MFCSCFNFLWLIKRYHVHTQLGYLNFLPQFVLQHSTGGFILFLPFFSSSSHVLLNGVSKLGLFGAFNDLMILCVDVEAVVESLKTETGNSLAIFISLTYWACTLKYHKKHITSSSDMSNPKPKTHLSDDWQLFYDTTLKGCLRKPAKSFVIAIKRWWSVTSEQQLEIKAAEGPDQRKSVLLYCALKILSGL